MKKEIETVMKFYSEDRIVSEFNKVYLKPWEQYVIKNFYPEASRILNIGCGKGREAFSLYDMGHKVTAVDISEKMINAARELAALSNRNIEFHLTEGIDLPFEDSSFDIVIMWAQAFGNVFGAQNQKNLLKECYRVLKPSGLISFSGHDYNLLKKDYERFTIGKKFYAYEDTECYNEMFTIEELEGLAGSAGFKVLVCEETGAVDQAHQVLHCLAQKY